MTEKECRYCDAPAKGNFKSRPGETWTCCIPVVVGVLNNVKRVITENGHQGVLLCFRSAEVKAPNGRVSLGMVMVSMFREQSKNVAWSNLVGSKVAVDAHWGRKGDYPYDTSSWG